MFMFFFSNCTFTSVVTIYVCKRPGSWVKQWSPSLASELELMKRKATHLSSGQPLAKKLWRSLECHFSQGIIDIVFMLSGEMYSICCIDNSGQLVLIQTGAICVVCFIVLSRQNGWAYWNRAVLSPSRDLHRR